MKYAMVIIKSDEEWEGLSDAEREFDSLIRWWADLRARGKIVASGELAPPRTAATVSWRGQEPIVTDGPYMEAKESVGGLALLDVESAAEVWRSPVPGRPGSGFGSRCGRSWRAECRKLGSTGAVCPERGRGARRQPHL
jgi:hypothetical protein